MRDSQASQTRLLLMMASLILLTRVTACEPSVASTPLQPSPTGQQPLLPSPTSLANTTTPSSTLDGPNGEITAHGSWRAGLIVEHMSHAFNAQNPQVQVDVNMQDEDPSSAIQYVAEGRADVGMVYGQVPQSELDKYTNLQVHPVAWMAAAVVVHPDVGIDNLTLDQVQSVFAGEVTNWREVGGDNDNITVFLDEKAGAAYDIFTRTVMHDASFVETSIRRWSSGAPVSIPTFVSNTPGSIGFTYFPFRSGLLPHAEVEVLAIDGVEAKSETAVSGAYPIGIPLNLVTASEPSGVVEGWLDFILSKEGQAIIAQVGYIPAR